MKTESDQKSFVKDVPDVNTEQDKISKLNQEIGTDFTYTHKIKWFILIGYIGYHILGFIGSMLYLTLQIKFLTFIFNTIVAIISGIGVTMGAHRLFTHHTFKATKTLQRVLIILFIINGHNSLWAWVRNHRQHHKYSDTDADPHNSKRGLVFSHIGWFLTFKNPKVIQYGNGIDMSDLNSDPWIMFQKRYFVLVYIVVVMLIPTIIPVILWNEDPVKAFLVMYCCRTCFTLNLACTVNSLAHAYGTKPYDKSLVAAENKFVSFIAFGEGWHNYHHAFPWDYRTAEFGKPFNVTTSVIDWCAKKGWAYDLKTVSEDTVRKRIERTGSDQ